MGQLFNRTRDEQKRRNLRQKSTVAEAAVGKQPRDRQVGGYKFRRQYGIAQYVADFCCAEYSVIVELDGTSHEGEDAAEYDENRQRYFESLGFEVVRYRNEQVYRQLTDVMEDLLHRCNSRRGMRGQIKHQYARSNPSPRPSPRTGRGSTVVHLAGKTKLLDSGTGSVENDEKLHPTLPSPSSGRGAGGEGN